MPEQATPPAAPAAPPQPQPDAPSKPHGLDVSELVSDFSNLMKGDPPAKKGAQPKQDIAPVTPTPTPETPTEPKTPPEQPKPEDPNPYKPVQPAKPETIKEPKPGSAEWNMAQMRETIKSHAKEKEELQAKLKTLEEQVKTAPPELQELRSELEKYQTIVQRRALAEDPRFQAAFDQPIENYIKESVGSVEGEKAPVLESILRMAPGASRDKALREAADDLDDFSKAAVLANYMQQKGLEKNRATQLANHKENLKQMLDMERAQQLEKGQQLQSLVELELSRASQAWPEFADVEGDAEHNATAAKNRQMVKDFVRAVESPKDMASLLVWAARGRVGLDNEARMMTLLKQSYDTIKELQGAQPNLEGNQGAAPEVPKSGSASMDEVSKEFIDEFNKLMKG